MLCVEAAEAIAAAVHTMMDAQSRKLVGGTVSSGMGSSTNISSRATVQVL
jgi:hypothetical protein